MPLIFVLATLIMSIGQVRVGFAASVEPPETPVITISSPKNNSVYINEVPLVFTIIPHLQLNQKGIGWAATGLYSLDGKEQMYVPGSESGSGQTVLGNLSDGMHSLVVYAFFSHSYSLIPVPTSEARPLPVSFASQPIVFWVNSNPANTNVPDYSLKPDSKSNTDSFLATLTAVALVAVVSFGLVAYFARGKRMRQHE